MIRREYKPFGFCCGLGGGAKGFKKAASQVGNMVATRKCIGGIDMNPAAARDFEQLVGVKCTVMDLFTRAMYTAFHGKEPPAGWHEATAADIRRAAGNERPNCVFISSPCKGASGLLSEALSRTPKYQALNELTLRCVWLMCEAWKDDPVELIVFENVPRLPMACAVGAACKHHRHAADARPGLLHRRRSAPRRPGQAQQRVPDRPLGPGRWRRHQRPRHRPVRAGPARIDRLQGRGQVSHHRL